LNGLIKEQQDLEKGERNRLREEKDKQQDKQTESEKREKEKEQHEKEEHEKYREFEIEWMKFERNKMDFELQTNGTVVKNASSVKRQDEEGEGNKEGSVASGHTRQRIGTKGPKMPCFDERSDDMDSFLHRVEVYADSQR